MIKFKTIKSVRRYIKSYRKEEEDFKQQWSSSFDLRFSPLNGSPTMCSMEWFERKVSGEEMMVCCVLWANEAEMGLKWPRSSVGAFGAPNHHHSVPRVVRCPKHTPFGALNALLEFWPSNGSQPGTGYHSDFVWCSIRPWLGQTLLSSLQSALNSILSLSPHSSNLPWSRIVHFLP